MSSSKSPRARYGSVTLIVLLALVLARPTPTPAAELDKLDSAIKDIPADAAFFHSFLRNREQVEAVAKSKAWARLTDLPTVQTFWQLANDNFRQWVKMGQNQDLVELLLDMASSEVFFYGGANWAETGSLLSQLYNQTQVESTVLQLAGGNQAEQERLALAFLRALQRNLERVQVPELVIGCRVGNVERATAQLKRIEELLRMNPELKDRLQRGPVAGGDFLTLTLDGKLVPWEQLPPFSVVEKPEQFKDVVKKLQSLQLSVSIGVRGKYVLAALGSSTAQLARLGQGKRLIDTPALKPLEQFADRRLTSISYTSAALHGLQANTSFLDSYLELGQALLEKTNLPAEQRAKLKKDLEKLAGEMRSTATKAGPSLDFSFLGARGYEGYTYDWNDWPYLDGTKPLTILEHVGGSPLLLNAGRGKSDPRDWPRLVRFIEQAAGYAEEFGLPQLPAEERDKARQFLKTATPLLKRLEQTTRELLLPALGDGQGAFVLDAKLMSKRWQAALPLTDKDLPLLEPALVLGISDAAKLGKAFADYRSVINQLLVAARKATPNIPEFEVPAPEQERLKSGTCYFYPLPEFLGLDRRLVPNAAVSARVAVLALSKDHSERLLAATPLKIDSVPLADPKRARAAAVYVDCAGLIDALAAWVEFGIQAATAISTEPDAVAVANVQNDTIKQLRTVVEALKCLRSYSSATYPEKGAWVTHRETVIRDLP